MKNTAYQFGRWIRNAPRVVRFAAVAGLVTVFVALGILLMAGRETLTLKGHTSPVTTVAFSPDGKRLASTSWNPLDPGTPSEVKVWDATTGHELLSLNGGSGARRSGSRMATTTAEGMVSLNHTGGVQTVVFSPDGKRLASASHDQTVKVWDSASGQETLTLIGFTGPVRHVEFSPDGKRLASASNDPTVKIWDTTSGRVLLTLKGHRLQVWSVAFSPDGKRLASASNDGTMNVWDAATGEVLLTLEGHIAMIYSVSFSPDGKRLVSAGGWAARVWDAASGELLLTLKAHTRFGLASSVAFSPDGKRLATTSWNPLDRGKQSEVKVWDATTGQEMLTLKGRNDKPANAAFSADGTRLAWAGSANTVKVRILTPPQ